MTKIDENHYLITNQEFEKIIDLLFIAYATASFTAKMTREIESILEKYSVTFIKYYGNNNQE